MLVYENRLTGLCADFIFAFSALNTWRVSLSSRWVQRHK